jgi:hypothetical protein
MDRRFNLAMQRIAAETGRSPEYLLGYRRGLQRGFYGTTAVADAEHGAWLALATKGLERSAERLRGYLDGTTAASDGFAPEVIASGF